MVETLLDTLLTALNREGISAYREFAKPRRSLETQRFFVTAAVSSVVCGAPVPSKNGTVLPAEVTLRLRYHCRTDSDFTLYYAQTDAVVQTVLEQTDCNILRAERGEVRYLKQLDRCETETVIVFGALLHTAQEGEDAS